MPDLPSWLRQDLPDPAALGRMRGLLRARSLHTVCASARCPNAGRCWGRGTATFMLLGDVCTRACHFCAVKSGIPQAPDQGEPQRIAAAVKALGLKYVVLTSVTRDDLADEGAGHFAFTVSAIRQACPDVKIELLVPDLAARGECIRAIMASGPHVFGHNLETVRRMSSVLRPQADHERSLEVLRVARAVPGTHLVKSGLMVGLGETDDEVLEALGELKAAGCDAVTVGQYLAPMADGRQRPVARFVEPKVFEMYRREGMAMGFSAVLSGPLVRSSFMADHVYDTALEGAFL